MIIHRSFSKQSRLEKQQSELRDSCSEAEEVYEGRDVNEDWASYVNTAADLDNQLDAAVELLKDTECTVTELNLMKKSVDEAKDALLGIWDKLTVTIKPMDKEMLGANDKIAISSEFDDLQIRYTIDGNEPTMVLRGIYRTICNDKIQRNSKSCIVPWKTSDE